MKNRQRGLGVFDFILWGAIAAAVFGLYVGINNALKDHYVGPEKVKWEREKAKLNSDKETLAADKDRALEANASLEEQFSAFRKVHNDQIRHWSDAYDEALKKRGGRDKETEVLRGQIALDKFNYIVALGKPDGGFSCDQLDTVFLEEAKRKVKYYGGANTGPVTPAKNGSGVRLAEPPTPAPAMERPVNPLTKGTK